MLKTIISAELIARFLILLIALPFAVVFLIFMALGIIADIFFKALFQFTADTKARIAFLEQQLKPKQ